MIEMMLPMLLIAYPLAGSMNQATQSDWSGGRLSSQPPYEWTDTFYSGSHINHGQSLSLATMAVSVDSTFNSSDLCTADIDNDGDLDICYAGWDPESNIVRWLENNDGTGYQWTQHIVSDSLVAVRSIAAADLNSDGAIDLVAADRGGDRIVSWINEDGLGSLWSEIVIDDLYLAPMIVSTGDLDGDLDIDVIAVSRLANDLSWWENEGGSGLMWTRHTISNELPGAAHVTVVDLDQDGDNDLLVSVQNSNEVVWFENLDGSAASWQEHLVTDLAEGAFFASPGDVDGDGDIDVACASWMDFEISWVENLDGTGLSWSWHLLSDQIDHATSVTVADLDDDGDMDVLGSGVFYGAVWWENVDGSGSEWIQHDIDRSISKIEVVRTGDIDGDGNIDILGSTFMGMRSVWWKLSSVHGCGELVSNILYVECDPAWGELSWNGVEPLGTHIGMQVRSSDEPGDMGSWSDTIWYPGSLEGILAPNTSYFQYKVILVSEDNVATPVLEDVTVSWDPMGISEQGAPFVELLPFYPNPSNEHSARFILRGPADIRIDVFDLTGRSVYKFDLMDCCAGYHCQPIVALNPGMYFCRLDSEGFSSIKRFLVVE